MEESGGVDKQSIEEQVNERDRAFLNPAERALAIYNMLHSEHPSLTTWDLTCFSAYWLLVMSAQFEWLKSAAKEASKLVTFAHYNMSSEGLISVLSRDGIEQLDSRESKDEPSSKPDSQT